MGPPERTEAVGAVIYGVIGILLAQRPERARWSGIEGISDHRSVVEDRSSGDCGAPAAT